MVLRGWIRHKWELAWLVFVNGGHLGFLATNRWFPKNLYNDHTQQRSEAVCCCVRNDRKIAIIYGCKKRRSRFFLCSLFTVVIPNSLLVGRLMMIFVSLLYCNSESEIFVKSAALFYWPTLLKISKELLSYHLYATCPLIVENMYKNRTITITSLCSKPWDLDLEHQLMRLNRVFIWRWINQLAPK